MNKLIMMGGIPGRGGPAYEAVLFQRGGSLWKILLKVSAHLSSALVQKQNGRRSDFAVCLRRFQIQRCEVRAQKSRANRSALDGEACGAEYAETGVTAKADVIG
ncbi:hypothetical protein [Brevibacillus gelatini]|uniref:hypothetical protein n=1 Tax=Brevibacillus gelatini TaxID=1655277 RepID=UPI001B85BCFA